MKTTKEKRKRILSLLLIVSMVIGLLPQMAMPVFAADVGYTGTPSAEGITGGGRPDDPFLITNADQLAYVAKQVNAGENIGNTGIPANAASYQLGNGIDLSCYTNWTPIGTLYAFNGTFDGADKTITGLTIGSSGTGESTLKYVGLFGLVGGTIKNLNVDMAIYSSNPQAIVGGLVGMNKESGKVTNCSVIGNVSGENVVGGLVGQNKAAITNCYTAANVIGKTEVGGLVGQNGVAITNCYATGKTSGGTSVGGLVGNNNFKGAITNCYATGATSGSMSAGGLSGFNSGAITNCYATGTTSDGNSAGGLSGDNSGAITNCYATGATSGEYYVGGLLGGNSGAITNCYATGATSGKNYVGGLLGQNDGNIINGYWNSDATQTVNGSTQSKGLGVGTDTTTKMISGDIKLSPFVTTLNTNLDTLANTTLYKWKAVSNEYPTFSNTLWTAPTITIAKAITIGTAAPVKDSVIADGTNTVPTGTESPVVTWSEDGGSTYIAASGTFAAGTAYKTKYVYTASTGYAFDSTIAASNISVTSGTVDSAILSTVSKINDTLTITVSWPATAAPIGESSNWLDEINSVTDTWDNGGTINNAQELAQFSYNVSKGKNYENQTITLVDDIDLDGKEWTPIGIFPNFFSGTFEGDYKKITGLKINPGDNFAQMGLFGYIKQGTVKNLGVDVEIYSSKKYVLVGGLSGVNSGGTIKNCYARGSITCLNGSRLGGLIGQNNAGGKIINCYATDTLTCGNVSGAMVGGLIGDNDNKNGLVINSYATGKVTLGNGKSSFLGGFAGQNCQGKIINCYATGVAKGGDYNRVGGLVGVNSTGEITNCYSTGDVSGGDGADVADLVGWNVTYNSLIKNGYWNSDAEQRINNILQSKNKGIAAGTVSMLTTGMASQAMHDPSFAATLNDNVTDNISSNPELIRWKTVENDYPTFVTNAVATSTMSGTVKDKDSNPVSGATVTLTPNAGTPNPATTGTDGKYTIDNVPNGSYTITVTLPNGGENLTKNVTVPGGSFDIKQPTETTYFVSGTVKDNANNPTSGANVKLMKGNTQIGTHGVATDSKGEFTITGVPNGRYNLVVSKDDITVTTLVIVSNGNNTLTSAITLPKGKTNSLVEVKPITPDIVVGNLDIQFDSQDLTHAQTAGNAVEIKLVAEKKAVVTVQEDANKIAAAASNKTVELYLDLSVLKTITTGNVPGKPTKMLTLPGIIEIILPLPQIQGKDGLAVYRVHSGAAAALANGLENAVDGEYFVVNGDIITIYTKKFSTYAIAYQTTTPPVTPPTGDGSGGHSGGSVASSTITTEPSEGGKITISNDKKIATITPNDGYVIADVMVDGKSVGTIEKYTFTDSKTHKINAVFVKETDLPYYMQNGEKIYIGFSAIAEKLYKYIAPAGVKVEFKENPKSFKDNTIAWAKPSIDFVTEREIFLGTTQDQFGPNESMTRAMFVTVIGRLYERSYGNVSGTSTFSDVSANGYYAKYVAWANENGIIKGIGENKFAPNDKVTREQMAVIMQNFATYLKKADVKDSSLAYADSTKISTWAIDGAKYCQETKVITGRNGGNFAPQESATRAEVAAVIERFIKTILK